MLFPSKIAMTDEVPAWNFDCVGFMQQARDRISAERAGMNHDETRRNTR